MALVETLAAIDASGQSVSIYIPSKHNNTKMERKVSEAAERELGKMGRGIFSPMDVSTCAAVSSRGSVK